MWRVTRCWASAGRGEDKWWVYHDGNSDDVACSTYAEAMGLCARLNGSAK